MIFYDIQVKESFGLFVNWICFAISNDFLKIFPKMFKVSMKEISHGYCVSKNSRLTFFGLSYLSSKSILQFSRQNETANS